MFRFDGDVFLFGTAIAAPSNAIKMATTSRPSRGGRIVANRRPYSETPLKRKSGGSEGRIANERVGPSLMSEGRHWPVPGNEGGLVAHRP